MENRRRLNPHAPPFYPASKFHHRVTPPPPEIVANCNKSARYLLTSSLSTGPRIKFSRRSGGDHGGRKFREIIPLNPDEDSTSVMIRNIPNNYTSLLIEFLENHCKLENERKENTIRSEFDFVYLPIDFKHRLNVGYAFVNFTTSEAAWKFHEAVKGKQWELFQSRKIAEVTRARIQGKEALVKKFERMKLCSPSSEYLPVWFERLRDGGMMGSSSSTSMKMYMIGEVQGNK